MPRKAKTPATIDETAQATWECRALAADLATVEVRQAEGDGPQTISWYPSLFDTLSDDLGGFRERIGRRAFTKTLQEREVRALVNHDPNQILSRSGNGSLKVSVDLRGLHAASTIPDTSYARDLLTNLENGNITGGSFAFLPEKDSWALEAVEGEDEPVLVRTVQEAKLFDVSLETFPAYPATEGSASLRSLAQQWRERLTRTETPAAPPEPEPVPVPVDLSRYRRRLDLWNLKIRGG